VHLVDLDGAKSSKIVNYKYRTNCESNELKIDFGGGLKSDADLKIAFESGANQITGGSIAVKKQSCIRRMDCKYGQIKSF
jgi:phosphoribosylformimino-5-aminoimidazole carboxamide ribotide isomerase